ncbi:NLE1 [Ecytonucleospora hepatopenaei]|uniref:NLE1 n=1 Tax=Ecytonucleospora hepatopenaei TaxID=646526 RepID=A0A1W0E716_9MICR|nr:NLE1 [Ecytonucleospora hepatopenaei]
MSHLLVKLESVSDLENISVNEDITQVPSNITCKQLKSLFNLSESVSLYVNGNMIINTLEESLNNVIDSENIKIIKVVETKGSAPASYCSSVISGHNGPILKSIFYKHKNKTFLCTAGADKTVRFWDLLTKTQFKVNQQHNHWVMTLCELDDYIVSGSMDSSICVFDKDGKYIRNINKQKKGIVKIIKVKDNEFICGARDGSVVHYSIEKNIEAHVHIISKYQHKDSVSDVCVYKNLLCSSSIKGVVKVFELHNFVYVCDLNDNQTRINCVSMGENSIITGDDLGNVVVYQISGKGAKVKYRVKHKREVISICIDPNGINFASASFDKTVKGWNLATGECLFTVHHVKEVYTVKYLNDLVISAGKDRLVKTYRPSTKEHLNSFVTGDEVYDVCYENKKLVAVGKDSNVYFFS